MANAILTPTIIANEALMHLENELVLAQKVNVDYSREFTGSVGDTINVRRPIRFVGQSDNLDVSSYNEDIEDANVEVKIDKTETVKFELTPQELTLDIASSRIQQILRSAVIKLRDRVETEIAELYPYVWNFSGTPGTRPQTFLSLAEAGAHMTDMAVPQMDRCAVHTPLTAAYLADSLKSLQASRSKAQTAIERVSFGYYGGFENYESVHVQRHTVGVATGTPLVNGGSQAVTYATAKAATPHNSQDLVTDGWTNSTTGILKAGDVITIAGVYSVNPISKQSTGRLQNFTVLEDADSGASTGPATLKISPAIIVSGPYQTVSAEPADDAVITVKTGTGGTAYEQSMLFHPDAFLLVSRPLNIASGSGVKTSSQTGNRMTIRVTEQVDFDTLKHQFRLDILFGVKAVYPDLAMRLTA
jgi:hypothetical protein